MIVKKICIWSFVVILFIGLIIMSVIIAIMICPILLEISEMTEIFIGFIEKFLDKVLLD